MATNNEFLIDHRNPMDEDLEDHSQFKPTAITPEKNVLLGGEQATSVADGTFLVDDEEQHHHHHEQQQQQHSDEYPPHQQCDGDDDISVRPNAPVAEVEAAAAVVDTGRNSQPHSSSIDDFEFIATPPTTTEHREQVKMDNLLDFDAAPTATATAPPAGNLVETLLTGEDLKPHKEAAAAYLENEFTQLTGGSQQPQDFNFVSAKPIKDVYNDFMEAERGGRVDLMHEEPHHREPSPEPLPVKKPAVEEEEKPIETISSAPFIPTAAEITTSKKEYISDDDEDDLLEDFAPAAPAMRPQQPVPEPEPIVKHEEVKVVEQQEEVKKNVVIDEKKEEPVVELPVKHVEPAAVPEPVVIKPKPVEVEVPKAAPISTPAAAAVQPQPQQAKKQPAKKDELITTSAEEMFCKFGLGE